MNSTNEDHTSRSKMQGKMITVWMPFQHLNMLDQAVRNKIVANRSEGIREAVRDYLKFHNLWPQVTDEETWKKEEDSLTNFPVTALVRCSKCKLKYSSNLEKCPKCGTKRGE